MPIHNIPSDLIEPLVKGPSPTKTTQVANLQNYIQELLSNTHHTFLQGSYKNDTAISDINDVDIVAVRLTTYSGTFSSMHFEQSIPWEDIFSEIERKLRSQTRYTWTVTRGDKCIKIRGTFNADVVPAVQIGQDHLVDPIAVYSFRDGREKINYPRDHYENGIQKNDLTDGKYKPVVRMFKNWVKNHFPDNNIISSFKTEALVHDVETSNFRDDYGIGFYIIADAIIQKLCQCNVLPMRLPSVCRQEDIGANWGTSERNQFLQRLQESNNYVLHALRETTVIGATENWKRAFNI
ncbi:MAG: hypothetical protein COU29_02770 [Candidatus Magasanikbacteria bacterium CG10_big_fil_rev_8_21_14_0_10_36_32]|uniref:cGAS/DncV-like nucleotidyltransferase C-terminal helical domain-containing protein n=1 Tax=Candidatus Magasanikbacteria bacterium CG10_big_fil_rev_8_21_14_0_10_36_32 TaxID=1974646 RepID=A0A2M6W7F6_9BACT|nr:MAG: hypothetical protein COU29_02770 [Candidatus Magasanikbacteria bacterium CG10_big_fil_rev_8_21_14_0_10_36_32]